MFPLPLSRVEEERFNDALVAGDRLLRFKARLLTKNHRSVPTDLEVIDGEVVFDTTDEDEPTRTAHVVLADEGRRLDSVFWFDKLIRLHWGIWVHAIDQWVDVPVFTGPVQETARVGKTFEVSAAGKEIEHLPPHIFYRSTSVRKHTLVHRAIRSVMEDRGESEFDLEPTKKKLPKSRSWGIGVVPWRVVQRLSDAAVDKQLFYRGDGTLRLRTIPDRAVWKFHAGQASLIVGEPEEQQSVVDVRNAVIVRGERTVKREVKAETTLTERAAIGDTSIKVDSASNLEAGRKIEIGTKDPDVRTISGSYTPGSKTVPLTRALDHKHPVGSKVLTRFKDDVTRRVVGRARLAGSHPLSAQSLNAATRPRVRVIDRANIHKVETAQATAEKVADRMKVTLDADIALEVVPVPHLEERDIVHVDIDDIERRVRLQRWALPLNNSDAMPVNWHGRELPKRRKKRRRRA